MSEKKKKKKKEYAAPKITHTEVVEARAVTCAQGDSNTCAAGPLQS